MGKPHHKNKPADREKYSLYLNAERMDFLRKIAAAQSRSLSGQVDHIIGLYIAEAIAEGQQDG